MRRDAHARQPETAHSRKGREAIIHFKSNIYYYTFHLGYKILHIKQVICIQISVKGDA